VSTRTRSALVGLLALAALAGSAEAAKPRALPETGPHFNVKGALNWDQFKGKVVVVDFWNHH
jgi:hypothetical protein